MSTLEELTAENNRLRGELRRLMAIVARQRQERDHFESAELKPRTSVQSQSTQEYGAAKGNPQNPRRHDT